MVIEKTGVGSGGGVDVMLDEISVGSSCSAGKKKLFCAFFFFFLLMNTLRHKICYLMSVGSWILDNLYPANVGSKDDYVLRIIKKKNLKFKFQNKRIIIKGRLDKKVIVHRVINVFALL